MGGGGLKREEYGRWWDGEERKLVMRGKGGMIPAGMEERMHP
jgi:hypothetical protein